MSIKSNFDLNLTSNPTPIQSSKNMVRHYPSIGENEIKAKYDIGRIINDKKVSALIKQLRIPF